MIRAWAMPALLITLIAVARTDRLESRPAPGTTARADTTVIDTVAAGQVLVRELPTTVGGSAVSEYRGIVVPARGWIYGRSFYWRVPSDARDRYTFLVAGLHDSVVDTVRLDIMVTPPDR